MGGLNGLWLGMLVVMGPRGTFERGFLIRNLDNWSNIWVGVMEGFVSSWFFGWDYFYSMIKTNSIRIVEGR